MAARKIRRKDMAKYKAGDKVVIEIKGVEVFGDMETHYAIAPGIRIRIESLDELAEPYKAPKPAAKKSAAKK